MLPAVTTSAAPGSPVPGGALSGRVALVTGAASGIGRASARRLAAHGARVAVLDREPDGLDATVEGIVADGGEAQAFVIDLADRAAIAATVDDVRRDLGPVTIIVNAAGIPAGGPMEGDGYETMWDTTFAVNLDAQVILVRACLDDLVAHGAGRIVNIASTEGIVATRHTSPYTASKHAVVGLTKSLAVEFGRRGVTANAVCPGPINTGMTALLPDDDKTTFARRRVPIGRYGEPEEIAYMVVALVMPEASYVNGAVIPVDGGLTVHGR